MYMGKAIGGPETGLSTDCCVIEQVSASGTLPGTRQLSRVSDVLLFREPDSVWSSVMKRRMVLSSEHN